MAKFSVPVKKTIMEVWIVEARSATEAGGKAMFRMANGETADDVRNVSQIILAAHRVVEDAPSSVALDEA